MSFYVFPPTTGPAQVIIYPSGDVTGATDYANVSQFLTAKNAKNILLWDGDWYFNNTLVRMPFRNATNTDWNYNSPLGRNGEALLPDFMGRGSDVCRLHFTNNTIPAMYIWRPPAGVPNGPVTNVRVRANAADTSNDPYSVGGGKTGGFSIIGAANYLTMTANNYYDIDNEAQWANHIGIASWGSTNYHEFEDIQISKFEIGMALHDLTAGKFTNIVFKTNDICLACGIQTDGNYFNQCWFESCRVGVSLVWDGWQTGTGRVATFAGIGRESAGVYLPYGSSDNDANLFINCNFVGACMSALAGHAYVNNTQNVDYYEGKFQSCYFESNASIMYGFRNIGYGAFSFSDCNFRGLCNFDTVGTYVQNGVKTGPIQEILRKWIPGRFGVGQATADFNFGCFWGYGQGAPSVGNIDFKNCKFDAVPYQIVNIYGNVGVNWEQNYSPINGQTGYPTIYANLTNAQKGYRVSSNGIGWNNANSQDWGKYYIRNSFVKIDGGIFTGLTTAVALPAASAALRGEQRAIIGAGGAADTTYTCLKSAADTYSWVLVSTG